MTISQRLRELGIELPPPPKPVGSYAPAVVCGKLLFTSGQLPLVNGVLVKKGKIPSEVSIPDAQDACRQAVLNALAAISGVVPLDSVARIVRLNVLVNSSAGFCEQAKIANGASDLLMDLFGQAGLHSRVAAGAAELPLGSPVELDLIVELK